MNAMEYVDAFCDTLRAHAMRKAKLYDGVNSSITVQECIVLATEELGEIATASVRSRDACITAEAIDLAHCAILIAMAADKDSVFIRHVTRALGETIPSVARRLR